MIGGLIVGSSDVGTICNNRFGRYDGFFRFSLGNAKVTIIVIVKAEIIIIVPSIVARKLIRFSSIHKIRD